MLAAKWRVKRNGAQQYHCQGCPSFRTADRSRSSRDGIVKYAGRIGTCAARAMYQKPFFHFSTCFRVPSGAMQSQSLSARREALAHLLDDTARARAFDRNASGLAQEPAERAREELALGHECDIGAERAAEQKSPDAVPPRRMRRGDEHEPRHIGQRGRRVSSRPIGNSQAQKRRLRFCPNCGIDGRQRRQCAHVAHSGSQRTLRPRLIVERFFFDSMRTFLRCARRAWSRCAVSAHATPQR